MYLSVAVGVENVNNALHEWILLQFGQRHELVDGQRSRVVQVQLAEPLAQPPDLVRVDCTHTLPTLSPHTHTQVYSSARCQCLVTPHPTRASLVIRETLITN